MKRIAVLAVALAVLLSVGCQQQPVDKPQAEATESPEGYSKSYSCSYSYACPGGDRGAVCISL